jgi:hypothetical protein
VQLVHGDRCLHELQGKNRMRWKIGETDVAESVPIKILILKYSDLYKLDLRCGGRRAFLRKPGWIGGGYADSQHGRVQGHRL